MKVGGKQCIRTIDRYIMPLDIINGLPYLKMEPNTEKEFEELPHVILTSGDIWDPTVLDNTLTDRDDWYNTLKELDDGIINTPFDQYGNYRKRTLEDEVKILPSIEDPTKIESVSILANTQNG